MTDAFEYLCWMTAYALPLYSRNARTQAFESSISRLWVTERGSVPTLHSEKDHAKGYRIKYSIGILVWDHFDLVAGSGLGGLVAIMLGPLGMNIEDAIDDIQMLGVTVFESVDVDAKKPVVDGQTLKDALETILEGKNVSLRRSEIKWLIEVQCAFLTNSGDKPMMRTYIVNKPSAKYNIVDGVVASISQSLLTSPTMECTLQTLIDNATTFTSPIVELVEEVKLAFNAESQAVYLLHVGSGGPNTDIPGKESGLEYHYISVDSGIEKDTTMAWTTWDLGA
ncbi:hypothetical protein CPB86DRAFT_821052, partial [Serendipita vermifera]